MSNLRRVTIVIVILSVLVKLSGFLRESVVASKFGATEVTDGYLLAFSFITLIIAMTTAGFNNVFLPMYVRNFKESPQRADANAVGILNFSFCLFVVIGVGLYFFTPYIFKFLLVDRAYETGLVAIEIMRTFSLFLVAIAINGILESYLQSKRIFIPIQYSKLIVGLSSALFPLFFAKTLGISSIAYGFITGSILGIIVQIYYLKRDNFKWSLNFKVEKPFYKEFIILLIPAILNATLGFINGLVDKLFATAATISGAVTYLNHSSLLVSIPHAIFSTTIAAILFTMLSETADNNKKFRKTLYNGMQISLLLFLPIVFGMLLIAEPLVSFIFERGEFTSEDTKATFMALFMYSPIVFTQGVQLVISRSLYAKQQTKLILKISVTTIFLNVILNALLVKPFGYLGLAAASSIVSIYYLVTTTFFLYKSIGFKYIKPVVFFLNKSFIATLSMTIPLYFIAKSNYITSLYPLIQIGIIVPLGVIFYVIGTFVFNREGFNRAKEFVFK